MTGYIPKWFTATHPSRPTNPAVHGREFHSQSVGHKSESITTSLLCHLTNLSHLRFLHEFILHKTRPLTYSTSHKVISWLFHNSVSLHFSRQNRTQNSKTESMLGLLEWKHLTAHWWLIVRLISCVYRLPYVEATILELLRYKTLGPFAVAHSTLKDTEVGGYFIPKGTMVSLLFGKIAHRGLSYQDYL